MVDHEPLDEIESGDVSGMVDSSSADLLAEMNGKMKKIKIWPFIALVGLMGAFVAFHNYKSAIPAIVVLGVAALLSVLASIRDRVRKTTVLLYDLEPEAENLYQKVHDAFEQISSCMKKWHVEAAGAVKDWKRNAGATDRRKCTPIALRKGNPPYVRTNLSVPCIPVGKQTMYFLPDKVLVIDSKGVGAVSYCQLRISVEDVNGIERGRVPKDARVVGKTWKYVNKGGGPDKRFKNNRKLPIVLYEDIHFTSDTGLNERIEVSKTGVGREFRRCINALAKGI